MSSGGSLGNFPRQQEQQQQQQQQQTGRANGGQGQYRLQPPQPAQGQGQGQGQARPWGASSLGGAFVGSTANTGSTSASANTSTSAWHSSAQGDRQPSQTELGWGSAGSGDRDPHNAGLHIDVPGPARTAPGAGSGAAPGPPEGGIPVPFTPPGFHSRNRGAAAVARMPPNPPSGFSNPPLAASLVLPDFKMHLHVTPPISPLSSPSFSYSPRYGAGAGAAGAAGAVLGGSGSGGVGVSGSGGLGSGPGGLWSRVVAGTEPQHQMKDEERKDQGSHW